ncbi:serine/threonine protein kinase [Paenibacillus sp. GYB003]|uniref:serine/threonine protein kinase n=1 Tax=Paenibacillus sp. GYB003 TaxID=2994392 RepID=UPI002F96BC75
MKLFAYWRSVYEAWIDYPKREGAVIAGQYRILRFLGIGSYGLTYVCVDADSGREVVLKQAKPSKRAAGRQALRREADVLTRLRHPSIPQWLASFEYNNGAYMATELVRGQTVEDFIFERGVVFSELETLRFVRRLVDIVAYVHEQGFVHSDIRIPNVILNDDRIHLIDFGLACRIGEPALRKTAFDSSAAAPNKSAEPADDLYAIGHFMLFMLYSGFEPRSSEAVRDASWENELTLSPATRRMLRKLLRIDSPYSNTRQFARDVDLSLNG